MYTLWGSLRHLLPQNCPRGRNHWARSPAFSAVNERNVSWGGLLKWRSGFIKSSPCWKVVIILLPKPITRVGMLSKLAVSCEMQGWKETVLGICRQKLSLYLEAHTEIVLFCVCVCTSVPLDCKFQDQKYYFKPRITDLHAPSHITASGSQSPTAHRHTDTCTHTHTPALWPLPVPSPRCHLATPSF